MADTKLSLWSSGTGVVRWVHRRRLAAVCAAARAYARTGGARTLLDYGCGDGQIVRELAGDFERLVGVDIGPTKVATAIAAGVPANAEFLHTSEFLAGAHDASFDVVVLSQVLEHVSDDVRDRVLDVVRSVTHDRSVVLVEVPIESGPVLLVKSIGGLVLRIATRRGYSRDTYSVPELWERRSIRRSPHRRPPHPRGEEGYYGHKDFSVWNLRTHLAERMVITGTEYLPVPRLRWWNLQALFHCTWRRA
ncbi:MAG TPA: class I SAM-dependent methyltransferase [Acidimicrobiales bacterium]|nr:class I SAM-dependent methyltransferase [Acidimicrobiales bacterium]